MDIDFIVISEDDIKKRVAELGLQISEDYKDKEILVICVLRGAAVFMSDLIRRITPPVEIDFVTVSSYGSSTTSSGEINMTCDINSNIVGKHVLIVEDIIDTGLTMSYLKESLLQRNPASLKICAFLDKPSRRKVELATDYIGYEIEDHFVVGYGLDFNQKGRQLPYIAAIKHD